MSVNDAIYRMMADLGSDQLALLLQFPSELAAYLRQEYLPARDPPLPAGALEAMEQAQDEEQTMNSAAYVWWKLPPTQRDRLLEVSRSLGADSDDLQQQLDLHLPN